MGRKYTDNALTTLASSIAIGATTLTVAAGKGNNFPQVTGAGTPGATKNYFVITLEDASGNREKIRVEHRAPASDVLGSAGFPLVRGYDGTTARAWNAGDSVDLRMERVGVQDAEDMKEATKHARLFGEKDSTTTGLTWGYYGGPLPTVSGITDIADGTVALTDNTTNYVEATAAGAVSANTTGFTDGSIRIRQITTSGGQITVSTDKRAHLLWPIDLGRNNGNAIINGNFEVWQRNTTFASIAHAAYHADRWSYTKSGAMVHDISRSTDVPSVALAGRKLSYSLLVDCTTADAAIAAGDESRIVQFIEGYRFRQLAERPMALVFCVKATKTGRYCVGFGNSGNDRSYVAEYDVNTTNTWERKAIVIPASPSAGTWDLINGVGLSVAFTLAGGSTYQTTPGAWQTGSFFSTANQVNGVDNTANNFQLAGVELVPLEQFYAPTIPRSFAEELALCQRYYQKTYDYGSFAGAVDTNGAIAASCTGTATASWIGQWRFGVPMRTTPTVTIYSPSTGASGNARRNGGAADVAASTLFTGQTGASLINTAAVTDGEYVYAQATASAEL